MPVSDEVQIELVTVWGIGWYVPLGDKAKLRALCARREVGSMSHAQTARGWLAIEEMMKLVQHKVTLLATKGLN